MRKSRCRGSASMGLPRPHREAVDRDFDTIELNLEANRRMNRYFVIPSSCLKYAENGHQF